MNERYPRRSLFGTEERTLFCSTVGRDYHLSVLLPQTYATSDQAFPVIYLLDGDIAFGMTAGLTEISNWASKTPEVIVVGIGYDMASYEQWAGLREVDFKMPDVPDSPPDSCADRFLDALTQEMIPFIEANYRTIPSDRCLYGYSSSGFFVLYTLFHRPDAFRRYLSGSGDLYLAYPYLMQHDEHLAARHATDPIELYMSVGGLEPWQFPFYDQFIAYFENRNYPWLKLITEIYPDEGHGAEGAALTYLHGLRKVYPKG